MTSTSNWCGDLHVNPQNICSTFKNIYFFDIINFFCQNDVIFIAWGQSENESTYKKGMAFIVCVYYCCYFAPEPQLNYYYWINNILLSVHLIGLRDITKMYLFFCFFSYILYYIVWIPLFQPMLPSMFKMFNAVHKIHNKIFFIEFFQKYGYLPTYIFRISNKTTIMNQISKGVHWKTKKNKPNELVLFKSNILFI